MTRSARFAVAVAALALSSGASAQTSTHVLAMNAPAVTSGGPSQPALVTALDEQIQFQRLVTSSPAERVQLAARIVRLCDGLAPMEGSPVGKIEAGYVIAASLYGDTDFPAARSALVRGAEFATARGEVIEAANRYLDVVMLTIRQPVRTAEDVQQARDFHARARALAKSSLLSPDQRSQLLKRIN